MQVTIGLPFANNRLTLPLAVRSIFAQTHKDWELLLVEDCSTDGSVELLAQIRDPRVHLVRNSVNRGLALRLNEIATLARGRYVARMDADDAMHPDRIRRQISLLDERPDIDVLSTGAYTIDNANRVRGLRNVDPPSDGPVGALDHGCWIHPTAVARKAWFEMNPYDEQLTRSQDYDLWARVYGKSKFATICEPLFFYREIDVFNLARYLATKRADRAIIRRYAPALIGRARTEWRVLQTQLKSAAYIVLCALRAENLLVNRRSTPIDDAVRVTGEEVLCRLEATPVPGWNLC